MTEYDDNGDNNDDHEAYANRFNRTRDPLAK
jgi:hypothetical protein